MRLFYASFLDSENMRAYETLVASISAAVPNVIRPIPRRTHHLTMAFIGEIDDRDLDRCLQALEPIAGSQAFDYSLGSPRILYARRSPRLICVDVERGAEMIDSLQAVLRESILQRFPRSQIRAQNPHVTLARFKRNARPQSATGVSEALQAQPVPVLSQSDRLVSIHLVRSSLTSSGPVYESLGEVKLAASR